MYFPLECRQVHCKREHLALTDVSEEIGIAQSMNPAFYLGIYIPSSHSVVKLHGYINFW